MPVPGRRSLTAAVATGTGCHNLPAAAKSAVNFTTVNVTVYCNADCRTGAPGRTGDLAYGPGSLHWANFPYRALSYRVTG
ncbi:hypothetical protein [Kitasatospora griseola]|uniref:hypothetical protein n=1 Tax=Kitasatospora griseola TaxID=2064 RepID=UPI0037F4469C